MPEHGALPRVMWAASRSAVSRRTMPALHQPLCLQPRLPLPASVTGGAPPLKPWRAGSSAPPAPTPIPTITNACKHIIAKQARRHPHPTPLTRPSPLPPQLHQLLNQLVVADRHRHDATREERPHRQGHRQHLRAADAGVLRSRSCRRAGVRLQAASSRAHEAGTSGERRARCRLHVAPAGARQAGQRGWGRPSSPPVRCQRPSLKSRPLHAHP